MRLMRTPSVGWTAIRKHMNQNKSRTLQGNPVDVMHLGWSLIWRARYSRETIRWMDLACAIQANAAEVRPSPKLQSAKSITAKSTTPEGAAALMREAIGLSQDDQVSTKDARRLLASRSRANRPWTLVFALGRQLGEQVRPVSLHDAAQLRIDSAD